MIDRRHVLAGMTATGAAVGLAACGSGSSDEAGSGSSDGGSAASSSGGPVELTYMHRLPDGEGMTKVADIVARWNEENPDIQVTAVKFDGQASEMITRIESEAKAGNGADLAQLGYAEIPNMFTKGLVLDVAEEASKYEGNFAAGAFGLMKVGEAIVGLPQDTGPLVYFYNEAAFNELGLTVPTTSEELLDVAAKAKEQGKLALAFQPDEALYGLSGLAAAAGAVWFTPESDAWTVNVASAETDRAASFWQSALDAESALTEQRWGDGFKKALVEGTLIGTIGAAWESALLVGDMAGTDGEGAWKVAQLPTFGDEQMTGPDGGSGVAILKDCKDPVAAMKFNDWFNTQVADLATQGLVLAASEAAETPESMSAFFGGQDVMGELAKANELMNPEFIYMPTWPALQEPMVNAASAAASGQGEVADVYTAAQETAVSSLKDAGLPVNS